MRLTADMFAQCYGFVDKFTLKFLIGAETSINILDNQDTGRMTEAETENLLQYRQKGRLKDTLLHMYCMYQTVFMYRRPNKIRSIDFYSDYFLYEITR